MKLSTEQRPSREAVLSFELESTEVEPYLDRAYKKVVGRLNIPGFRKGKAPRKIVEQLYGREYLLNEALQDIVGDTTSKAVEQESLEMAGLPQVSVENIEPLTFKATIPLTPSVDLGDYMKLRVPKERVSVGKSRIEASLDELRQNMAPWEPADGPVALNGLITVSIEGWADENGERSSLVKQDRVDFVPRENSRIPVPGFADRLVGLPKEEHTEFDIDIASDFENSEIAGKKTHWKVIVHEIKRKNPPALDDEFAKGVGDGFESLDALRAKLREDMTKQEEDNVQARHQEEAVAKLVDMAKIEISPLIVEQEMDHYLEETTEAMRTGRMSLEHYQNYLAWQGKSAEEIHELARPKAEERLRRALVIREIVKQQQIDVTDDEIDAEIESMATDAGPEAKEVRKHFQQRENKDSLRRVLQNRKAVQWVSDLAAGKLAQGESKADEPVAEAAGSGDTEAE